MDEEKQRKTISLTHRQAGAGLGVIGAIALVAQLKGAFVTREEGDSVRDQLSEVKVAIVDLRGEVRAGNAETIRQVEKSANELLTRIREETVRNENRLLNLEFVVLNKPKREK